MPNTTIGPACPACSEKLSAGAIRCGYCGAHVGGPPRQGSVSAGGPGVKRLGWLTRAVLIGSGTFAAFIAFGFYVNSTPEGKARLAKREAIEECRRQQADELSPLNVRRFVRDTCGGMDKQYREEYGRSP